MMFFACTLTMNSVLKRGAISNSFSQEENEQKMARYRNVCFTLNNPEDMVMFDDTKMEYLVYQEPIWWQENKPNEAVY